MKHRLVRFFKNKYAIGGTILAVLIIIFIISRGNKGAQFESADAVVGNVVEKVSVTGTVSPIGKADLAFEKGGVVDRINFKVGDSVKKGQLIAAIDDAGDAANLAQAQANYSQIARGLRPEELSADQAVVSNSGTSLQNAKKDAVDAARDAYVKAQSAIVNYADTFFFNPQSANPVIKINTNSQLQKDNIDNERLSVSDTLTSWQLDISGATNPDNAPALIAKTENYLSSLKNFLGDIQNLINQLNSSNDAASQSTITAYSATINNALSTLNGAITSVTSADTALRSAVAGYAQAQSQFSLQKAGSSAEDIASARAKVDAALAEVNKDRIYAPIDGVLTKADPNVGEFVSPGTVTFAVQSLGDYKIEAFVPEADIAKLALHDSADVTLDAYGQNTIFKASVAMIDPAETVLEGVPTYKVTLYFDNRDDRIRSGMTANTDILTHEKDNVVTVPSRAIITDDNGNKTVRIVNADGKTYSSVQIVPGLKGSEGTTEIISGISAGDKVVTYVK